MAAISSLAQVYLGAAAATASCKTCLVHCWCFASPWLDFTSRVEVEGLTGRILAVAVAVAVAVEICRRRLTVLSQWAPNIGDCPRIWNGGCRKTALDEDGASIGDVTANTRVTKNAR